jgi:hypothetical protein
MKRILLACGLLLAGVSGAQLIMDDSKSAALSEPRSLLLLGMGLFILGVSLRNKRKTNPSQE